MLPSALGSLSTKVNITRKKREISTFDVSCHEGFGRGDVLIDNHYLQDPDLYQLIKRVPRAYM